MKYIKETVRHYWKYSYPADGYQEIEYIKANGAQYIDTQRTFPNGFKVKYTFSTEDSSATGAKFPLGCHNASSPYGRNTCNAHYQEGYYVIAIGNDETVADLKKHYYGDFNYGTKYSVDASSVNGNCYLKINDELIDSNTSTWTRTNNTMYIFACNKGSVYGYITAEFYGNITISDENGIVFDFVPCKRLSDNVIGLYDKKNNVFKVNQGSGSFTGGDNKIIESTIDDYDFYTDETRTLLPKITDKFYASNY